MVLVERGVSAGILFKAALKKSNFNLLMAGSLPKASTGNRLLDPVIEMKS